MRDEHDLIIELYIKLKDEYYDTNLWEAVEYDPQEDDELCRVIHSIKKYIYYHTKEEEIMKVVREQKLNSLLNKENNNM